jgi:archaellum component FlaC
MSNSVEQILVERIEAHFTKNQIREAWHIIEQKCQKLPKLLHGEVKQKFQKAFNKIDKDIFTIIKHVEEGGKKTWNSLKESFEKFMKAVKPIKEAIQKVASEVWGFIVKACHASIVYCDHKAREFSTAIVKTSKEAKKWVQKVDESIKSQTSSRRK